MKIAIAVAVMMLGGVAHADGPRQRKGELKQLLLERFDRDQDGQLDRQERRKAARALNRLAQRLVREEMRAEMGAPLRGQPGEMVDPFGPRPRDQVVDPFGGQRRQMRAQRDQMRGQRDQMRTERKRERQQRRFMRRFDLNRDGDVGPGEMPPSIADELRPLDRDGDGWLRGDELP